MENKNEYFIPINEVAKRLDVPAHTLRYWEKQFPGAIRPTTGSGGRRYYRPDVVEKIQTIKTLLYDKGMTIAGVKKILHNGSFGDEIIEVKKEQKPEIKSDIKSDDIDTVISLLKQAYELL